MISNRKSKIQNPEFAFTLTEVLIAIALLGALMAAMLGFGYDMLSSRTRALDIAWRQRAAATLIERLETDLSTCIAADHGQSGVRGDQNQLSILSRGVASSLAERDSDNADVLGDLQIAEYHFDEASGRLEARRAPFGAPAEDFAFAPVGGALADVRFRYFDGTQWSDAFDSLAAGRLPVAVEVAVWFEQRADDTADESETASTQAFDERAFAMREDRLTSAQQSPDRRRVILIPDAAADGEETAGAALTVAPLHGGGRS